MSTRYTEPKLTPLNPSSSDMGKDWFVWFRVYDPLINKWVQKSYKKGINNYKSYRDRLREANGLLFRLKKKLHDGWLPILKTDPVVKEIKPATLKESLDYILKIKNVTLRKKTRYA